MGGGRRPPRSQEIHITNQDTNAPPQITHATNEAAQSPVGNQPPIARAPDYAPAADVNLAYLSHRQSLSRHLDPLLLGKKSRLPSVEDCQKPNTTTLIHVIAITGMRDRNQTESVIAIHRNAHGLP